MPRVVILVAVAAAAALLGGAPGRADTPRMAVVGAALLVPVDDPFPLTRLRVAEAQLPDVLKRFDPGTLVRLDRDDFEARVRKAALISSRSVPRLLKAEYTASLVGGDLAGTAEWTILNPNPRPAALPLEPFRLAVQSPTWADGRPAVIGTLGPNFPAGPAVWVEGSGQQVLKFKWSAAGTSTAGERQFELRTPGCPAATLDLDLPAGRPPTAASADVLVTGPLPATDPKRQSWRLRFADRTRLEFGVRGAGDATPTGVVLATLAARYDLAAGQVAATFEYDLQPTRGAVGEWAFALDPGLLVTDVKVTNRAGWRVDPATRQLRVTLRQPGPGGRIEIATLSPLTFRGQSPLPMVRPVGAAVGEERIDIRIQPDVKLEAWDAGDYRLVDSPDAARTLALVGTLLPAGVEVPFRRPPSVQVNATGPEFVTTEAVEWKVERGRQRVTAKVVVKAKRGPLFQVAFRGPAGFALGRVTATPDDLVIPPDPARGPNPVVEFTRPLLTGQSAELLLEWLGPTLTGSAPRTVPLPHVVPVGAAERSGSLRIDAGAAWAATVHAQPAAAPDAAGGFPFRGLEPDGEMLLTPVRPVFAADSETRLEYAGDRLTAATKVTLQVESGELAGVTVFEPGPATARTWKAAGDGANAVASAVAVSPGQLPAALPLLAAPWGEPTAVLAFRMGMATEAGTYWHLRFARPVTGRLVLETNAVLPPLKPGEARAVAADLAAGRRVPLTLRGAATSTARVELAAALGDERPVSPGTPQPTWAFADLYAVTVVPNDGAALVVFGGTVTSSGGAFLPIGLPAGAEVRAACVGGHWLGPGKCGTQPDSWELRLPFPTSTGPVRFEVRYRIAAEGGWALRSVISPVPTLPGAAAARRWWAFPQGVLPAWPAAVRQADQVELPVLLGDPLDRPGAVSAYAGDHVAAVPARVAGAVGIGAAALLAVLGWIGTRRARRSIGFALLTVLLGSGVAVLLGPAAWDEVARPPLIAAALGCAAVIAARGWKRLPAPALPPVPVAVALALCAVVPLLAAPTQPPTREVVFLLSNPNDNPGRETVLAPKPLLDKLAAAGKPVLPGAVLTSATYTGRAEDGVARIAAKFVVQTFAEGEAPVALPLADVRLEKATLDGKPAHPVAVRPDLYTVAVPGPGRHEMEVHFAVPVTLTGPEREVKFGGPEVPAAQLAFTAPLAARQFQAMNRHGLQKTTDLPDGVRLDADLGGVKAVSVRWRQGAGGTAVVGVREGCVWDVAEAGAKLNACYVVKVDQGAVADLRFNLPRELEPVNVAVRRLDGAFAPTLLRGWSLAPERNGQRQLRLDLQGPAEGRLLVLLECVPRSAPTAQPTLRFPQPVEMTRQLGIFGLRGSKVNVERVDRGGVIDYAADALLREFGAALNLDPAVPVQAFSPQAGEAWLRPTLHAGPEPWAAGQAVAWRVGPGRADAVGVLRWAGREPPPLIEFDLPESRVFGARVPRVRVLEVRGADVAAWAQTGGRVLVWLRKPGREGAVEWVGVAPIAAQGEPIAFEPVVPRLVGAVTPSEGVSVTVADGWAVRTDRDRGWKPQPGAAREWAFLAEGSPPPLRLLLDPPQTGAARGFGLIEATGPTATYRATAELPLRPGRPHHLVFAVAGLPTGSTVELDAPPGTTIADRAATAGERAWNLDVPASAATSFRATVAVKFPLSAPPMRLPAVELHTGGTHSAVNEVRWLGVVGGVRLDGAVAASPAARADVQAKWPGEWERLRRTGGSLWLIPDGRTPTVASDVALTAPPPPTVVEIAPPDTRRLTPPGSPDGSSPAGRERLLAAAGWCLAVIGLAALFARLPRLTWPEQLGLIAGLLGWLAGAWWVALPVAAAARLAWLGRAIFYRTAARSGKTEPA